MPEIIDITYTFRDYIFIQLNKSTPNLQLKCDSYTNLDFSTSTNTYRCIGCILYMNNNYVYVKFIRYDTETPFIVFGSKEIALTTTKENIFERIRLHGYIFLYILEDVYSIIKAKEQKIKSEYTVAKQKAETERQEVETERQKPKYTRASVSNLREVAEAEAYAQSPEGIAKAAKAKANVEAVAKAERDVRDAEAAAEAAAKAAAEAEAKAVEKIRAIKAVRAGPKSALQTGFERRFGELRGGKTPHKTRRYKRYLHRSRKASNKKTK